MVITTCQQAMKLFPLTWQHHHLMIASTTVPIIQWQLIFFLGVDQYTKANLRLDASLLQCTLRSHCPYSNFPSNLLACSCDGGDGGRTRKRMSVDTIEDIAV